MSAFHRSIHHILAFLLLNPVIYLSIKICMRNLFSLYFIMLALLDRYYGINLNVCNCFLKRIIIMIIINLFQTIDSCIYYFQKMLKFNRNFIIDKYQFLKCLNSISKTCLYEMIKKEKILILHCFSKQKLVVLHRNLQFDLIQEKVLRVSERGN